MNKYQRVMEHVKVDDEMKKRILQNVEKELLAEAEPGNKVEASKVVPFRQRLGDGIKRYGGMVAMVAILLVGTAAVIRITGGVSNTSAPSMSDSAMEAPAAAPAEEAAEAPAETESPYEEAAEAPAQEAEMVAEPASNEGLMEAESPVYDSEATAEQASEEPAQPTDSAQSQEKTETSKPTQSHETVEPDELSQPVGSAKTEGAEQALVGSQEPSAAHYIGPVIILLLVIAVIAFIIWLIIYLIRKYRNKK